MNRRWPPYVSWVGHRLREASIHIDRFSQAADLPGIIFSVSDVNNGYSSGLRGYAMARELRKFGWRTLVFPVQLELSQRRRLVCLEGPKVIIFQTARHFLNRPKYYEDQICVLDIDDADFFEPLYQERTVECLANSAAVIAGSRFVADFARKYNSQVEIIWTGSTPSKHKPAQKVWPPVVAFATSNVDYYPAECALVVSALSRVRRNDWQFWLFGVGNSDVGQRMIKDLQNRNIVCRTFPFMNYQKFLRTIEMTSIGLAPIVPSNAAHIVGKSFGKVLSYLSGRAVTVASDYADHPLFFQNGINGYLASSPKQFAECIELLLADGELRGRIAERAHSDYIEQLSTRAAAEKADIFLRELTRSSSHKDSQGHW
jgi:glycosyltransferase involved in cell wall biosynthesis